MPNLDFTCECPYCYEENILNLRDYEDYSENEEFLADRCHLCGNTYIFVLKADTFEYS